MFDGSVVWWLANSVVGVVVVLCLAVAVRIIYRGWAFLQVSTTSDWNSDETAVEHFLALLDEAKTCMVVHDDGNKMEGSIYENQDVIDAVRRKLSDKPDFRLSCHFNFDDAMPFTKELEGVRGVQIKTGQGDRSQDDVHYKIIDGGLKVYLSKHAVASKARRYKVIDCGSVPRRSMAPVADVLLRSYKNHAKNLGIWVA